METGNSASEFSMALDSFSKIADSECANYGCVKALNELGLSFRAQFLTV